MGINVLLLWLQGHPLPWPHLGWLRNQSDKFLLVDLTPKWQTSLCSTITNTAQRFRQLFLFSAPNTLEPSPFLFLDYCWYLPGTPNRQIPCWPSKDCTMVLFTNMSWKQCWLWKLLGDFPPVFSQSSPISLKAFSGTSVPLHLGASKNVEYLSLGVHSDCRKASNTNGQSSSSLNTNRDPVVEGASSSPTQTVEEYLTSLA